jgi:hypothetical protein
LDKFNLFVCLAKNNLYKERKDRLMHYVIHFKLLIIKLLYKKYNKYLALKQWYHFSKVLQCKLKIKCCIDKQILQIQWVYKIKPVLNTFT